MKTASVPIDLNALMERLREQAGRIAELELIRDALNAAYVSALARIDELEAGTAPSDSADQVG